MLRAPFVVRSLSLSNCREAVKVLWEDGASSSFTSTWLRASIRDPQYFSATSSMYKEEHLPFVCKDAPITSAELGAQPDDGDGDGGRAAGPNAGVKVSWEDHTSVFDASWLRAQDPLASSGLVGAQMNQLGHWDGTAKIPVYDHADKDTLFESWMGDLQKYGLLIVKGAPTIEKGMRDFMQKIGPLRQRYHPTDVFTLTTQPKKVAVDIHAYGAKPLGAHTDTSYYKTPARMESIMCLEYSAPVKDTVNYFVDSFRVIEDLRREDPEAFRILSTTEFRQGRRRIAVEEPCDPADAPMYDWDTYAETTPIVMDGDKVQRLQFLFGKHAGYLAKSRDDVHMKTFFRACQNLQERLDDPKYLHYCVITPGTLTVFDNYRVCHGRMGIHPSTSRVAVGCYITDETWNSRWRLIFGKRSGLADRWLYGCTDQALEILSQRMAN